MVTTDLATYLRSARSTTQEQVDAKEKEKDNARGHYHPITQRRSHGAAAH